eukprot:c4650_g1_i1.p1 GENE.c4650_g1_i1~~c4650_g1_i1.p1  ORF type:complete len:338 (+),score=78.77 c4650_g1_i1:670-1683(+)
MLRSHDCNLPIEVWFLEEELCESSQHHLSQISSVSLHVIPEDDLWRHDLDTFWLKPYVIMNSNFCSVLFLDSDNIAISNPSPLFRDPLFLSTGAVFWKDFWHPNSNFSGWRHTITAHSHVWVAVGTQFVWQHEQESGQLLVDRTRHLAPLLLALYYAINRSFYARGDSLWGDKDMYRMAFLRLSHGYHMIEAVPGSIGVYAHKPPSAPRFCGHTMAQHGLDGSLLFLHRNFAKLSRPGGMHLMWHAWQQPTAHPVQIESGGLAWKAHVFFGRGSEARGVEQWVVQHSPTPNKAIIHCLTLNTNHTTMLLPSHITGLEHRLLSFAAEIKGSSALVTLT